MDNGKLKLLRHLLKEENLDGFLVPRADAWPGEFVSERAERLAWLSGFTGSAGIGIVLMDQAVVLTDGRYTLQVQEEVDGNFWQTADGTKISVCEWLKEHGSAEMRIGYDPYLHSSKQVKSWKKELEKYDIKLISLNKNIIDIVWDDQPPYPVDPVSILPEELSGNSFGKKINNIKDLFEENKVFYYLFSSPDSIAWLLNVRGNDVPHTPVPLSYGVLSIEGEFHWFIELSKVPEDVKEKLNGVTLHPLEEIQPFLLSLNSVIGYDEELTPDVFIEGLEQAQVLTDPCTHFKACKNDAEQEAIRQAHIVDGHALIKFHQWLKSEKHNKLDELKVEAKLAEFRAKHPAYQGPSFSTIAGFNRNGAIIHYRAKKETNQKITDNGLLLIDSGGQYLGTDFCGTTDVTRTFLIGEATPEQRRHYTLVLKGHIAVARAKFPYGTTGAQIDALARGILWEEGLDFAHGLGHGVGFYLNVHEEAANLSPRGTKKLEPGMLLSNEPGIYLEGQYGIRIENLMFVKKTGEQDILGRDILCFETVTLAPYENELIDFSMLDRKESEWLESYYRMIEERVLFA